MQELRDVDFNVIKGYLIGWKPRIRLGSDEELRLFLNAVLWICYSGAQYRELPKYYGNWNTVYKRYSDWGKLGIWQGLLQHLAEMDSDLEYVMVDSTVVRAHACCSTGQKETQDEQGLGRSKGGFSSKVHMMSDAHGLPLAFCITAGQRADFTQAIDLLERFKFDYALMDKAYDSNAIIEYVESTGAVAVIPAKSNRKEPREHDEEIYKERHVIECTFGWLKYFRRIFSRFDKLKARFEDQFALATSIFRLSYLNNA